MSSISGDSTKIDVLFDEIAAGVYYLEVLVKDMGYAEISTTINEIKV